MKKRYTTILSALSFTAASAFGQISISESDMPSAGDTLEYSNAFDIGLDLDDTGPDHDWDFTSTFALGMDADTFVSVGSTPFLYQFFFNNFLLYPDHDATMAIRGAELDLGGTSFEDVYDYFKDDDGAFTNVGFGATVNGLPLSVRRQPVDKVYNFPMNYGDMDTSYSAFEVSVPLLGHYGQTQSRYNEVDGWGTISTPAGTFEALRVKSTLEITDTIYIDAVNFGFTIPRPESIEYKWLAEDEGIPVMQVNTSFGIPTLIRYKDGIDVSTGQLEHSEGLFRIYPNPAQNDVNVSLADMPKGQLQLEVFDMCGRMVKQFSATGLTNRIDVSDFNDGQYIMRLITDSGVYTNSFVVGK